ncbi:MAG: hypothetical protein BWZ08_00398 [candidate division BRC1 bacterium ADurb.BinA292]|mgnify:CR=1 FL=1|nr:MAG: hypothetical protein BWZ08_00398 [candidate division BRC1 bacterium ADurb.BinA292]
MEAGPPRAPFSLRRALAELPRRLRELEEQLWLVPYETTRELRDRALRWAQILYLSLRGFFEHRAFTNASSLTYTSLLTIVPTLALAVAVLKGFDLDESLFNLILSYPVAQVSPIDQALLDVRSYVANTRTGSLGLAGLLALLIAAGSLLFNIEDAMNQAWSVVPGRRNFARKLSAYLNFVVILIFMIVAFSMTTSGSILTAQGIWDWQIYRFRPLHYVPILILKVAPFLLIWFSLIMIYYIIPGATVQWRSAVLSALVAGVVFQLAQILYIQFWAALLSKRYNVIYGAFAGVLLLLVWIYVSWCVVLWGAELCSAHQNLKDWRRRRRKWHNTPFERETLALRLAVLLGRPLLARTGAARMNVGDMADLLMLPPGPITELLALFEKNRLVIRPAGEDTYLLARSPEDLPVMEVLRLVRHGGVAREAFRDGNAGEAGSPVLLGPLATMTVRDLTLQPLESVQSFAI